MELEDSQESNSRTFSHLEGIGIDWSLTGYKHSELIHGSPEWYTALYLSGDKRSTAVFYHHLYQNPFNLINADKAGFPLRRSIKYCNEQIIYLSFTVLFDRQLTETERAVICRLIIFAQNEFDILCLATGPDTIYKYDLPPHYFKSGWIDLINHIPQFKSDLFKNMMHVRLWPDGE